MFNITEILQVKRASHFQTSTVFKYILSAVFCACGPELSLCVAGAGFRSPLRPHREEKCRVFLGTMAPTLPPPPAGDWRAGRPAVAVVALFVAAADAVLCAVVAGAVSAAAAEAFVRAVLDVHGAAGAAAVAGLPALPEAFARGHCFAAD